MKLEEVATDVSSSCDGAFLRMGSNWKLWVLAGMFGHLVIKLIIRILCKTRPLRDRMLSWANLLSLNVAHILTHEELLILSWHIVVTILGLWVVLVLNDFPLKWWILFLVCLKFGGYELDEVFDGETKSVVHQAQVLDQGLRLLTIGWLHAGVGVAVYFFVGVVNENWINHTRFNLY